MSLDRPPLVLPLCLQRFSFHGRGVKDNRHIEFPITLDISPYLSSPPPYSVPKYRLYAVVVHYGGSISSGHYVAYVIGADNQWHLMDDAQVGRERASVSLITFCTADVRNKCARVTGVQDTGCRARVLQLYNSALQVRLSGDLPERPSGR